MTNNTRNEGNIERKQGLTGVFCQILRRYTLPEGGNEWSAAAAVAAKLEQIKLSQAAEKSRAGIGETLSNHLILPSEHQGLDNNPQNSFPYVRWCGSRGHREWPLFADWVIFMVVPLNRAQKFTNISFFYI